MAFSYRIAVAIDHNKVPNTDRSNFPMLFSGTYSFLKTTGNGGQVQNGSGYDIGFYADSALTSKLSWETERYVATTGEVVYWIKIPTVSSSVDTVFYMAWGDTGISSDQSDKANVWDSNYKGVYHLPDGSTLSANDSTSNANNLTLNNTPTAGSGQIAGGMVLSSSLSQSATKADTASMNFTNAFTISAWVKRNGSSGYMTVIGKSNAVSDSRPYNLGINPSSQPRIYFTQGPNNFKGYDSTTSLSDATWYYLAGIYDGSNVALYINGSVTGTPPAATGNIDTGSTFGIGKLGDAGEYFNGTIDEVRISNTNRSVDWLVTEYNNQLSPSSFYKLTNLYIQRDTIVSTARTRASFY